jgi:hypothetical protein
MKKMIAYVSAVFALAGLVLAGDIIDRTTVTMGTKTGTITWTNAVPYATIQLKRITVKDILFAGDTVTVARVTSDNAWTGTCGTVVCTSGNGTQATLAYDYLLYGDKVTFAGANTTGAVVLIEYLIQKP